MSQLHNQAKIIADLQEICGKSQIFDDLSLIIPYSTDWRQRYSTPALAVVFPSSISQIQAVVHYCRCNSLALIPQGGNTSTCGAATPISQLDKPQIIINLARLNKIIKLDGANSSITVEAGCSLEQVQQAAKSIGMYFPLSLASQGSCQIGGNLATNAGGVQVLKYGMMRDLTLGISAIMANGEELNQLNALRKNNTYLDLKQLLIGSEGTLGIITKATLKLFPQVPGYSTFLCSCSSITEALNLLRQLQQSCYGKVSAFEIISHASWELLQRYFPNKQMQLSGEWLILAEIEMLEAHELLTLCLEQCGINLENCIIAQSPTERNLFWSMREHIPLAEKQHGYAAKHDISLPLSQIENFLKINKSKLLSVAANGYFSIFGHLGDGNLHYNFGIANADASSIVQLEELINPLVYDDVNDLGGSIAAEHGIGQSKMLWLKRYCDPLSYQIYLQLKHTLDPDNLFNPGKVLFYNEP